MSARNRRIVDLEAIRHNMEVLCGALPKGVRAMAVVKADGYGHGGPGAARAALAGGAEMLAVAAGRFKARWERTLALRLSMLEPALLASVGLFVFALALALVLPVLSLANGTTAF